MTTWIHFTNDIYDFELTTDGGDIISQEHGGLFVYKMSDDFPVAQRQREWGGRDVVYIECDDEYVTLIQEDPMGDDRTRDEYVIPSEHFDMCYWWAGE